MTNKPEIIIKWDDKSVEVTYGGYRPVELAYIDKFTSMEDIAQGFLEICAACNIECEVEKL